MNGKSSNTGVKENCKLFFKHDSRYSTRIGMAHGSKMIEKFIKDVVAHSKLTANSFRMSTQQLEYPSLSSECRSMVFYLVIKSSSVVLNCRVESVDDIGKLPTTMGLFHVSIFWIFWVGWHGKWGWALSCKLIIVCHFRPEGWGGVHVENFGCFEHWKLNQIWKD